MISQALNNQNEELRFKRLHSTVGGNMALYIMCAYHNIPFFPELATSDWLEYLNRINSAEEFSTGVTDPNRAMEEGLADVDRWLRVWGIGNEKKPYTPADYRRMDEIYEKLTARRMATGGFDGQQEDVFRFCARTAHQRDKLMATGDKDDIDSAKKLDKMIQDNLAAENLRPKDAESQQPVRIDGVVERLNRIGLAPNMTYDDVMRAIADWMSRNTRYGCSMDAAEKGLLAIVNCTRANSDMPLLYEVPKEMRMDDHQYEFDPTAARREESSYGYLNLSRGRFGAKPKGSGE